jgi:hypothetical protein
LIVRVMPRHVLDKASPVLQVKLLFAHTHWRFGFRSMFVRHVSEC